MKCIVCCLLLLTAPVSVLLGQEYAPGELLVIFKPNVSVSLSAGSSGLTCCGIAKVDSINQANNCRRFSLVGNPAIPATKNDYLVHFPDTANIPAIAAAYAADPNVKWAGPNYLAQAAFTPNDALFRNGSPPQWAMDSLHLNLERAWDITKGGYQRGHCSYRWRLFLESSRHLQQTVDKRSGRYDQQPPI